MIPTSCEMPDLSGTCPRLVPQLLVLMMFGGGDRPTKSAMHLRVLAHLVDKMVGEYQEARNAVLAQIEEARRPMAELTKGRIIYLFGFTNHMENCLSAVVRLYRQLDRIKADPALAPDRTTRRLLEANCRPIVDVRNVFEHMDEGIHTGEVQYGEPVMLAISDDDKGLEVGALPGVTFDQLSLVVRTLHGIAKGLLDWAGRGYPAH